MLLLKLIWRKREDVSLRWSYWNNRNTWTLDLNKSMYFDNLGARKDLVISATKYIIDTQSF